MELANQLSMISVGVGIAIVVYAFVRHFRQRSHQKKLSQAGESENDQ